MAAKNSLKPVRIIMGSSTDYEVMKEAEAFLMQIGIQFESQVLSAHRTPLEVIEFAKKCSEDGVKVIIAGAGGAAHLPGMVAAVTELPVIGVPVPVGALQGEDALLSIVQMPKGVPVATVAIGNAWNAGVLAAQILATSERYDLLKQKLIEYKQEMRQKVLSSPL
ncbi:MAG: 5-(carboxyamino)imidazole ribonucleotide mutase [Deltaproteobacteria bacterium]|nr:5-(carboxyamino)imidazole ribonucleotide mutase [Deltaproteobacteria bacterium]